MKSPLGVIAAGCVIAAFIVGMFLGHVLLPAPALQPPAASPPKDEPETVAPPDKKWDLPATTKSPENVKVAEPAAAAEGAAAQGAAAQGAAADNLAKPSSDREKVAYCYGMQVATGLKAQKLDLNGAYLARGLKDALRPLLSSDAFSGGQPLLNEQELADAMAVFQKEMSARQGQQQPKPLDEKTKKEIADFLAENAKLEGVKATASGLQYKVLKAGDGPSPKDTDSVTVNYRGTFPDGTEFDSSYKRGQPASCQVKGVIKGWTEALQLMKVGDKWQLWIPPDLGYGGAKVMIFEVELLGINPKADEKPAE